MGVVASGIMGAILGSQAHKNKHKKEHAMIQSMLQGLQATSIVHGGNNGVTRVVDGHQARPTIVDNAGSLVNPYIGGISEVYGTDASVVRVPASYKDAGDSEFDSEQQTLKRVVEELGLSGNKVGRATGNNMDAEKSKMLKWMKTNKEGFVAGNEGYDSGEEHEFKAHAVTQVDATFIEVRPTITEPAAPVQTQIPRTLVTRVASKT